MRTIGTRFHGAPQVIKLCDICGTPWPRNRLKRGLDGLLRCSSHKGKIALELDMEDQQDMASAPVEGKQREET